MMTKSLTSELFFYSSIGLALVGLAQPAWSQTVQKVADLQVSVDQNTGLGYGPSTPETRLTLVGTNLWFTSNAGGAAGAGAVFSFDPFTSNITQLATLDNTSGKSPWSSAVVVANGLGWFTTSVGGTGNKGSLVSIDLAANTLNNVYSFPTNDYITSFHGQAPHSTPVQIGQELWFTCSAGGTNSTYGTVTKYNLTNGAVTDVFLLNGTNTDVPGRQPLGSSLVPVLGTNYYFLTFAGGVVRPGAPNGAGVLDKITFDAAGNPKLSATVLPGGFISFPAGDPVFDGTNFLYFTTAGSSTNVGAIVRYNLTNGALTSLFNFVTNAVATTNYGKQPYGTPVLFNNTLYFTTLAGGTQGKGVLDSLVLSNGVVSKLADFEGVTGQALGASPQYGGGTIYTNPITGSVGIYFPINKGGVASSGAASGNGTIIRVALPPPPIVAGISNTPAGPVLTWVGGYGPFNVDTTSDLQAVPWTTNWLSGLLTNAIPLDPTIPRAFFRVSGASQ